MTRRPGSLLGPVLTLAVLVVGWELAVRLTGVAPYVLPAPSRVWEAAARTAGVLPGHLATTLSEAGLGLLTGVLAAGALALIFTALPRVRRAVHPLLVLTQTVPTVVLAPLLIIWTGFGMAPKVIVVALTVFFPVLVAVVAAVDGAGRELVEMVTGLGGSRRQVLTLVQLPAALPAALAGLRIAAGYTIGAAVVAEYMAGDSGLGVFIQRSRKAFAVDQIFVAVALIGLLTAALFLLIDQLCRRVLPWQYLGDSSGASRRIGVKAP